MRGAVLFAVLIAVPDLAGAQGARAYGSLPPCQFTHVNRIMRLAADCRTSASIVIPDGETLDGGGHTIYAVEGSGKAFSGGVVVARGGTASIVNTNISAISLTGECHTGADRLRGIYFEDAAGEIRRNVILNVYQGSSACVEGNAIEVRSRDLEGPAKTVHIEANVIDRYQKSGIVIHGPVDAVIESNAIGASAAQRFVPANGIQVGPGARARIENNLVFGNSFPADDAAGTAILLIDTAPGTLVARNVIRGNADVGIHVFADAVIVESNELDDDGPDGTYDVGIVNLGNGNIFRNNTIRGYKSRSSGVQDDGASALQIE
jgi:parallel beta helix pectate lyase-like protein